MSARIRLDPKGLCVNHNWQAMTGLFLVTYRMGRPK